MRRLAVAVEDLEALPVHLGELLPLVRVGDDDEVPPLRVRAGRRLRGHLDALADELRARPGRSRSRRRRTARVVESRSSGERSSSGGMGRTVRSRGRACVEHRDVRDVEDCRHRRYHWYAASRGRTARSSPRARRSRCPTTSGASSAASASVALFVLTEVLLGPGPQINGLYTTPPFVTAVFSGARRTAIVGAVSIALNVAMGNVGSNYTSAQGFRTAGVVVAAIGAVGLSMLRQREQRHLLTVSRIAEVAQLAVLRNLPPRIGPAQVAVRYVSATAQAHVGGDFYEALRCNGSLRAIVGDVRGKGLEAVQLANVLVGAFRGADHDHVGLAELARTLDQAFLRFEPGDEDFATVVMVELRDDGGPHGRQLRPPPSAGRHRAAGSRRSDRRPTCRRSGCTRDPRPRSSGSSPAIACSCTPTGSSRAATQGGSSTSMRTHRWCTKVRRTRRSTALVRPLGPLHGRAGGRRRRPAAGRISVVATGRPALNAYLPVGRLAADSPALRGPRRGCARTRPLRRRAGQLDHLDPVLPDPPALPHRPHHGRDQQGADPLRGPLLRAHVVHHRRLPPLLLPPQLPDEPRASSSSSPSAAPRPPRRAPLWWAAHHRDHHRYSDTEQDLHSPLKGFWWSHVGWILCDKNNGWDEDDIKDFAKYPELRFLNKHDWIAPWTARRRVLPDRRVVRAGRRVLLVDRAALARHLHRELARPRDGAAALRHHRHQPELGAHRAVDRRRGLAQQPPLLPGVGPQRLLLVGVSTPPTTGSRCSAGSASCATSRPRPSGSSPDHGCATASSTWACSRPTGPGPPPPSPPPARSRRPDRSTSTTTSADTTRAARGAHPRQPSDARGATWRPRCTPPRSWPSCHGAASGSPPAFTPTD